MDHGAAGLARVAPKRQIKLLNHCREPTRERASARAFLMPGRLAGAAQLESPRDFPPDSPAFSQPLSGLGRPPGVMWKL